MKSRALWIIALLLGVAATATIDAPPVFFDPPPWVRMGFGTAAVLMVIIEACTGSKKPKA